MKVEIGMKFNRLTVVEKAEKGIYGHPRWACRCDCGSPLTAKQGDIVAGRVKSCGCLARDLKIERNTRHGMFGTPEYNAWNKMMGRCLNEKDTSFPRYGGRGITICAKWRNFVGFFEDMGLRPSPEYSLDRINNDGNYEPGNCRWATRSQQGRNRSTTRYVIFDGITKPLPDWCDLLGVGYDIVLQRMQKGYSFVDAVTTPRGATSYRTFERDCKMCGVTMNRGHSAWYCLDCYKVRERLSKLRSRERQRELRES